MDEDVEKMSREQLAAEVKRLGYNFPQPRRQLSLSFGCGVEIPTVPIERSR